MNLQGKKLTKVILILHNIFQLFNMLQSNSGMSRFHEYIMRYVYDYC